MACERLYLFFPVNQSLEHKTIPTTAEIKEMGAQLREGRAEAEQWEELLRWLDWLKPIFSFERCVGEGT